MTETRESDNAFRVVVFADFVCPYSFLAAEQMDRMAREYDVRPLWRPHWLHPDTPPEGTPREPSAENVAKGERLHAWIKEMAPDQYPRIQFPTKRHYSFRAFEAMEYAYDEGLDFELKTAIYDLMWTEGRDIADPQTLADAGERAGLDAAELKSALDAGVYVERALAAVTQAHAIGITNTPTIFLGRTRINGWHYYEVLESVLAKQGVQRREAMVSGTGSGLA